MLSVHSDQHTSTLEEEDPTIQKIPRSIDHLKQCLAQAQARLEHLNTLTIPHSELTTDFALQKTNEFEAEKNRIRNGDIVHMRQIAETYLMRYKEAERRNNDQTQRMHGLEIRAMMAETICAEQMELNREIGKESIRALQKFADIEGRRISMVNKANTRNEELDKENNRLKSQCEQLEQAIGRFREQVNSLNQETTSLRQQLATLQSDKSSLLLERDRFVHENEEKRIHISQMDELVDGLRERELELNAELRERDAQIESLVKNRSEFQNLLAEKERDIGKHLKTKEKEITAELNASHREKIERYHEVMRKQKKDFEDGLQEALKETQKLASERDECLNNWRQLEETIEARIRKWQAKLSRKMVSKCTELVRDLKDIGSDFDNRPVQSANRRTLEPVENVAQRILEELASQRESGMS